MIHHDDFGDIQFKTIYFHINEPLIFSCSFTNSKDMYIGLMVEDYTNNTGPEPIEVRNYYFVGANESEIKSMENHKNMIRTFFSTRPVWFLNYQYTEHGDLCSWRKESRIDPRHTPAEDMTLCF